jgi:hypothetical protein
MATEISTTNPLPLSKTDPQVRPTKSGIPRISILDTLPNKNEIYDAWEVHYQSLQSGEMTLKDFYHKVLVPLLPNPKTISYTGFKNWHHKRVARKVAIIEGNTLMEREESRQKAQIMIRQDATSLMATFLQAVRSIAKSPRDLKENKISIVDIYKIIREEEDRSKALQLKEREEDRADAKFAFMVSMARAGQLVDEDIAFLNEDVKRELLVLKKQHGIYQLPTKVSGGMGNTETPAENPTT